MTALLKSGSAVLVERVRPLAAPRPDGAGAADPEHERLERELAALEAALAARDEIVAALTAQAEAAFLDGEATGREAGRREAEDHKAALIETIEGAAERAAARFEQTLEAMERLAALLAQTCLERMLLGSEDRARLVADLIHGQVDALQAEAIVRIDVSAEDFTAAEALELPSPGPHCRIVASTALESGDCTIVLQLGTLEIGLNQQWGALRDALEAMIAVEAGR